MAHLSTFCGSTYFVAPELLNCKIYTGPEVDVWSFGVVLYVLVCGKVPFDDQSMVELHTKIKRGHVEYPAWLSASKSLLLNYKVHSLKYDTECKHLLSRMLVANPAARVQLPEVLNHPWMHHKFPDPPESHIVHRKPLQTDELDRQVIRGMKGLEFGSEDDIERKLIQVLESDSYVRAVQAWERRRDGGRNDHFQWRESVSNSPSGISFYGSHKVDSSASPTVEQNPRRFSSFGFYRRKLFAPASFSPPPRLPGASLPKSQSHLNNTSLGDADRETIDPTGGFHPLLSMYYLSREKLERERVYGPGFFPSSRLSIQDSTPAAQFTLNDTSVPPSYVKPPQLTPLNPNVKADYETAPPQLPAADISPVHIKRVLDRMQIQYRKIKLGVESIHLPSINALSARSAPPTPHCKQGPLRPDDAPPLGRSISWKTSKLSLGIGSRAVGTVHKLQATIVIRLSNYLTNILGLQR
jgi:serine/threonine protein kinase KIN1/2